MKTNITISLVIIALVVIMSIVSDFFYKPKQAMVLAEETQNEETFPPNTSSPDPTQAPTSTPTTPPTLTSTPKSTVAPTPTLIPQPTATTVPEPTTIPTINAPDFLEPIFESIANQYGVDVNLLKKVAKCESNFNPGAQNGPYGGMYQYTSARWEENRKIMGLDPNPDLRFNAEESIKTAAFFMVRGGISMWPNCH